MRLQPAPTPPLLRRRNCPACRSAQRGVDLQPIDLLKACAFQEVALEREARGAGAGAARAAGTAGVHATEGHALAGTGLRLGWGTPGAATRPNTLQESPDP